MDVPRLSCLVPRLFGALMLLCLCVPCLAADWRTIGTSNADRMLAEYFRTETAKLRDRCLADVKTLDDWKTKREVYRKQLFEMLSLEPLPEKTELAPVITGKVEHDELSRIFIINRGPAFT